MRQNRPGTGLNTEVQVADRPVTQQGMTGMRTAVQGPGRQVQDKSYFLNEMRLKKQQLAQVLDQMNSEISSLDKDSAAYARHDQKYEVLVKDVKGLQGQLADLNIILDKVGTETPPEEIQQQLSTLKQRNEVERNKVDQIFTERANWESRTKEVDTQIKQIQKRMEDKMNELAPAKRQQYYDLQQENQGLLDGVAKLEAENSELSVQMHALEAELNNNHIKQRAMSLTEQIRLLQAKKHELEAEDTKLQLSPEEQREQLKQKILKDNQDVANAEGQIKELQDQLRKYEAKLKSARAGSASEPAPAMDTKEKYEQVLRQERELSDFIDNFDSNKQSALQEMRRHKDTIVQLLDRISKGLTLQGNLPSQRKFREMQDELEYKKVQMENAQTTQTRLQQELDLRKSELEKINTLEDKIKLELTALNTKIETMNEELVTFTRLDLLKEKSEETKRRMEAAQVRLSQQRECTKALITDKNSKFEAKRNQLQENELYIALEKLETKMRSLEQNIFQIMDFIKAKERETDYKPMLMEITNVCELLNVECQKAARL